MPKVDPLKSWRDHVAEHNKKNPNQNLKELLQSAKLTFKKDKQKEPTTQPKAKVKVKAKFKKVKIVNNDN